MKCSDRLACRLSKAALVCRHLRQLACAPLLLSNISVVVRSEEAMRAFLPWLADRAALAQQLSFNVQPAVTPADDLSAAQSWIAAFHNASQLRHLRISSYVTLHMLPLTLGVASLHSLDVEFYFETLTLVEDASRLTALQRLRLAGAPLLLGTIARLPTSLTNLTLTSYGAPHSWLAAQPGMPWQVSYLHFV